jgi:BTB/POZ domain
MSNMSRSPSEMFTPPPTGEYSLPTLPIRSENFWFEDGDIVLSVTEDDVEHHFRVHRAILTIASPVFRDMLSMPQPSKCESLPVSLRDDSVHDLKALLGALYYRRSVKSEVFYDILTHVY